MTMRIAIRDFQVIETADIEAGEGITLIAGRNAQGKSSVAKAVAAVLTGRLQPGGVTKRDAGRLVRAGRKTATATVAHLSGEGVARASWPKCELSTEGAAPSLHPVAAGIEHPVDMRDKELSRFLAELLRSEPSREDFIAAGTDAGIPSAAIGKVWEGIEALGWDGKLNDLADKARTLKAKWEAATGERWGEAKAASWLPTGWTPDLAAASPEALTSDLDLTKIRLEEAIAAMGASRAEIDRLSSLAAEVEVHRAASIAAEEGLTAAETNLDAASAAREALPPAERDEGLRCPCCGATLRLAHNMGANQRLVEAEMIGEEEMRKRRLDIASADGKLSRARTEHAQARATAETARARREEAERASEDLAAPAERGGGTSAGATTDVEKARVDVELAERRLSAAKAWRAASDAVACLDLNGKVRAIVDPAGLRQSRMEKTLSAFNDGPLAELAAAAKWPGVRVEPDMSVTFGGRPYAALAGHGPQIASDQFKARVLLQVAVARLQGDPLVIIDAADLLDARGRDGLIRMLSASGVPALVTMTFSAPDIAPSLERAGLGSTHWIERGVVMPLVEAVSAAEQPKRAA